MNDRDLYKGYAYAGLLRSYLVVILGLCVPGAGMAFFLAESAFNLNGAGGAAYLVAAILASLMALVAGICYLKLLNNIPASWEYLAMSFSILLVIGGVYRIFPGFSELFVLWMAGVAFFGFIRTPWFTFDICPRWGKDEFGLPLAVGLLLYRVLEHFHFGMSSFSFSFPDVIELAVFSLCTIVLIGIVITAITHISVLLGCYYFLFTESYRLTEASSWSMAFVWTAIFLSVFLVVVITDFILREEVFVFLRSRKTDQGKTSLRRFQDGHVPDFSMYKLEGWT